jgi:XTP/dITP diphosphohydrolase
MNTICLATNNQHKVEELQQMLEGLFEIKTLKDIGCEEEIPETADTFEGNSLQKARFVFDRYGIDCISDDSGLEVEALNGDPGVFSARYAGEHGNHAANIDKLLKNIEHETNRVARFRTSVTLIVNGEIHQFDGIVTGKITKEKRGDAGFGYDPVFIPDGYDITFAEMSMEEKNPISHRGKAVEQLIGFLKSRSFS